MKIHHEGHKIILFISSLLLLINFILFIKSEILLIFLILISFLSVIIIVCIALFFRIPNREYHYNQSLIYSPADGEIIEIRNVYESEYFKQEMTKVSVFMSIYNVHLNRVPCQSRVIYQKYHPGKHLVAFHPKSSERNEYNTFVFVNEKGTEILVRQIAGFIARRIRWYVNEGSKVNFGDEMGFIRFGSRVDIYLPLNTKVLVNTGDKVKAAIHPLAEQ